jgi:hypothetical protein
MKNFSFIFLGFFLLFSLVLPFSVKADTGLVICGKDLNHDGQVKDVKSSQGAVTSKEECHFIDLIDALYKIIHYLILIAGSLAAISFAYAGYLYLTAGGDEHNIHHAHEIFWKVAVGFVIMLGAWLFVRTIEKTLIVEDNQTGIRSYLE